MAYPGGHKEQHELYRNLVGGWTESDQQEYLARFSHPSKLIGDFTPYYLRALWVAPLVAEMLDPQAPILAILRNPITRFESAIRQALASVGKTKDDTMWIRRIAADAQWAGMYATQLDVWADAVGKERLVVLQYEQVRSNPKRYVDEIWGRLGLDPVPLEDPSEPSRTTTDRSTFSVDMVPGLRRALTLAYRPEITRLADYGIESDLWDLEGITQP